MGADPGGVDFLEEVDAHPQVDIAHPRNGQAHAVLAGIKHAVLTGTVVLEFQQTVAIGQSVNILRLTGVQQLQVLHNSHTSFIAAK